MLYVIRHGKTDWNCKYKLQGRTNIPLNDEGREMARKAAVEYKNIHFDYCFCSPLDRALETAKILFEGRNIPITVDNRLCEMSFGECEGTENTFKKPDCPMYKFFKDPENYIAPKGAETFEQLFARTGDFLRQVVNPLLEQNKDIVIVGHGAMNNSIICQVKNIPLKDFWTNAIPNCELIKLL